MKLKVVVYKLNYAQHLLKFAGNREWSVTNDTGRTCKTGPKKKKMLKNVLKHKNKKMSLEMGDKAILI